VAREYLDLLHLRQPAHKSAQKHQCGEMGRLCACAEAFRYLSPFRHIFVSAAASGWRSGLRRGGRRSWLWRGGLWSVFSLPLEETKQAGCQQQPANQRGNKRARADLHLLHLRQPKRQKSQCRQEGSTGLAAAHPSGIVGASPAGVSGAAGGAAGFGGAGLVAFSLSFFHLICCILFSLRQKSQYRQEGSTGLR